MAKKPLEAIMKRIKDANANANIVLEDIPIKARPAFEMRKRQGEVKEKEATKEYDEYAKGHIGAIFLDGRPESVEDFLRLAKQEGNTANIDVRSFYETISNGIWESIDRKDHLFTPNQQSMLLSNLRSIMFELQIDAMPGVPFEGNIVVQSPEHAVSHVREMVRKAMGDDFARIAIQKDVTKQCVASAYTGAVVPVVFYNFLEDEVPALSEGLLGAVTYHAEGTVDENEVIRVFRALNNSIRDNLSK